MREIAHVSAMPEVLTTRCCIAGGGPAGMMLGLLLARAGARVLVLEKHADFLCDFRGDTVHPSTLQVMHELGVLDKFLARPHDEVRELRAVVGDTELVLANFTYVPTRCKFIAMHRSASPRSRPCWHRLSGAGCFPPA